MKNIADENMYIASMVSMFKFITTLEIPLQLCISYLIILERKFSIMIFFPLGDIICLELRDICTNISRVVFFSVSKLSMKKLLRDLAVTHDILAKPAQNMFKNSSFVALTSLKHFYLVNLHYSAGSMKFAQALLMDASMLFHTIRCTITRSEIFEFSSVYNCPLRSMVNSGSQ